MSFAVPEVPTIGHVVVSASSTSNSNYSRALYEYLSGIFNCPENARQPQQQASCRWVCNSDGPICAVSRRSKGET